MSSKKEFKSNRSSSLVTKHVTSLLIELGIDLKDPNFKETPKRMAEWLLGFTVPQPEIIEICEEHAQAIFPHNRDALLALEPFTVFSICPHHFLPVEYRVSLGYIPQGKIVGLSKLIRITDIFARQPIVQEEFTPQLAELLSKTLCTDHVAVKVRGLHMCMRMRGVKNGEGATNTALLGAFRTDSALRDEFYKVADSK